jgi:hypothetical protein
MIRNTSRLLPYAVVATCLVACARVDPPAAPSTDPATGVAGNAATDPPTVESYTARMAKLQTELTDLGRHTLPPPPPSTEFEVACKCTVIQKPTGVSPPPPPPLEDVLALERGIAVMQVALAAARAGKHVEVVAGPEDR